MPTIDDLRARYPQATDMSDSEIIRRVSAATGFSPTDVANDFGVKLNAPGFVTGVKQGLGGFAYGLGRVVDDVVGRDGAGPLTQFGEDVQFRNPSSEASASWEGFKQNPWQGVKEISGSAIGSTIPSLIPFAGQAARGSMIGRGLMMATNPVAQTALAAVPVYGGIRQTQDDEGVSDIPRAAVAALGAGWIESKLGVQGALSRGMAAKPIAREVGALSSTPLRTAGRTWRRQGLEEGSEEIMQQPMQQWAAHQDPTSEASLRDTGWGGFGGLTGGLALGPFAGAQSGMRHAQINRRVSTDLLNPSAPFSQQQEAAQYQREFMAKDEGASAADNWYNDFMAQRFAERNDDIHNSQQQEYQQNTAARILGFESPEQMEQWYAENPEAPLSDTDALLGMTPERPVPPGYQVMREPIQFRPEPATGNTDTYGLMVNAPQQTRTVTDVLGMPLEQYGIPATEPIQFRPTQETGSTDTYGLMLPKARTPVAEEIQPAVAEVAPKNQLAQRFETTLKQAVSEGTVPYDHPIVRDWSASKKTVAEAKSFEMALDDVLRPNVPADAAPAALALPKQGQLAPVQQRVFDHIQQAINSDNASEVVDAKGVLQYQKIGDALGIERGSAKMAVDGVMRQIAKQHGKTVAEIRQGLSDRTNGLRTTEMADTEALGLSPASQNMRLDEENLFGDNQSMQAVESIGGSNSAVGENEAPPGYVDSVEPSENARKAAEANRAAFIQEALSHPEAKNAALDWDDTRSDGVPVFVDLTETDRAGWVLEYTELANEGAAWAQIEQSQRDFEQSLRGYDRVGQNTSVQTLSNKQPAAIAGTDPVQRAVESRESPAAPEARSVSAEATNPLETRAANLREVTGEKQSARLDKLVDRYKNGEIDVTRLTDELQQLEEQAFPPERGGQGIQYSTTPKSSGGSDAKQVSASLAKLFFSPKKASSVYEVVQSLDDLPPEQRDYASEASGQVQAFVDQSGKVWMIADNIAKGSELGVFLHEVGVHLGMESLLGKDNYAKLTRLIDAWAKQSGTQESAIAKDAVAAANRSSSKDKNAEKLAYFVEYAVKAGINPTAVSDLNSPIGQWFRTLVAALKSALQKFGVGRMDQLTAKDIVDLAYGAANLQLGQVKAAAANVEKIAYTESENAPREMSAKTRAKLIELYGGEKEYELFASQSDVFYRAAAAWLGTSRRAASTSIPLAQRLKERSNGIFQVLSRTGDFDSKRHADEGIGQFKGYTTYAEEVTDAEGNTTVSTFVITDEQVARARAEAKQYGMSANDVLAEQGYTLKLDISADGEFSIHGPEYGTRFYKQLEAEGKVEEARGENGEIQRYADGSPWTALTGASFGQLTSLLADVHARERLYSNVPHFGVKWKRATGATGKSDATGVLGRPGVIYFSEADVASTVSSLAPKGPQSTLREAARKIAGASGQLAVDDASHVLKKMAGNLMFLPDLVESVKGKLPSAAKWYEAVQNAVAERNKLSANAEKIAEQASQLKADASQRVNEFIAESTYSQKWGYDPKLGRPVAVDTALAQKFNRMSTAEQAIVKAVFQHGEDMAAKKNALLKELGIDSLFSTTGKLNGPYAPLKRFGGYVGVLKSKALVDAERAEDQKLIDKLKADKANYVVSYFDTIGQARKFAEDNAGKYALTDAFEKSKIVKDNGGMPEATLRKIMAALKVQDGMAPAAKDAFIQMLQDMHFQQLDEHNARTSGLKRENREGYDADMIRSFLSHARAESNFLANMRHGGAINDQFYAMQREAKDETTGKRVAQDEFNLIAEHYAKNLEHKDTPIQDRLMAMTSAWQLATSPAYHLTNAMQGIMVTVPRLAADFGDYAGAWSHLMRGYGIIRDVGTFGVPDLSRVKDAGLRGALQRASDMGVLDVGMDSDLTQFEATRTGIAGVDTTTAVARKALFLLRKASRQVETWNRVSAAAAAYNMAREHGQSEADAQNYAVRVLQTTQGDFSRTSAPLLLKKLPKVMTQYKKYQFMMGGMYAKAAKDAFFGQDPTTVAIARRMLAYKLFHTTMAAGALGMPLMNLVGMVFSALGGDDDEPADLERTLREAIGDDTMANMLLHGPLALAGLDMSAKLGDDKIFSILPYGEFSLDSSKGLAKTAFDIMGGPSGAQLGRFAAGVGKLEQGEYYKGLEGFMPKGMADAMKAFRIANDGFTLSNGDVMFQPDDISGYATVLASLGMPTTEMKRMDWVRGQQYELTQFYTDRSKAIQRAYKQAAADQDTDAMAELREDWMALQDGKDRVRGLFNGSHDALRKQPLSTLLRYPQTSANRERKLQATAPEL